MPAIKIKADEAAVPLDRAIIFRDFLTITRDVNKALILMRKTCLEGNNVVCATYKDQMAHYIRTMLTFRSQGERGPVEGIMRRMGEPEFETVKDIEELWERAIKEYPEITEERDSGGELIGRAGPEFLEEALVKKWEERLGDLIGPARWEEVKGIQWGVMGGEAPKPVEVEAEALEERIKAEEAILMRMKEELRQKLERMKG